MLKQPRLCRRICHKNVALEAAALDNLLRQTRLQQAEALDNLLHQNMLLKTAMLDNLPHQSQLINQRTPVILTICKLSALLRTIWLRKL